MPRGGARGQNLGYFFFFFVESFVLEQQVLFKVESLCLSMILDLKVLLAQGGARGQNLERLKKKFSICISSFMEAVVDELVTILG